MNIEAKVTVAKMGLQAIFTPANPDMCLSEAQDKCYAAGNKILDYGDSKGRELLVASEQGKQVHYAMVPELCPNTTFDGFMAHMKAAGFDVRGEGPQSIDGERTVIVWEKVLSQALS